MSNQHLTDHLTKGRGPFRPPTLAEVRDLTAERDALRARVAELEHALRDIEGQAGALQEALEASSLAASSDRPYPLPRGVTDAEATAAITTWLEG